MENFVFAQQKIFLSSPDIISDLHDFLFFMDGRASHSTRQDEAISGAQPFPVPHSLGAMSNPLVSAMGRDHCESRRLEISYLEK